MPSVKHSPHAIINVTPFVHGPHIVLLLLRTNPPTLNPCNNRNGIKETLGCANEDVSAAFTERVVLDY